MNRRLPLLLVLPLLCQSLTSCSWFSDDDYPAVAAAGDPAQVTPVGQTPAPPTAPGTPAFGAGATAPDIYATAPGAGAATAAQPAAPMAPAAPAANEQIVQHTVVSGDSLWKLARQYGTSIERIKQVNQMTTDDIFTGKMILVPSTNPPAGASTVPASSLPAAPSAAMPSATNPVVRPQLTAPAVPSLTVPARDPIAIPRPSTGGF